MNKNANMNSNNTNHSNVEDKENKREFTNRQH
jgi:hypothetical protein